jgi:uncharacterized protein YbaP (TraB family)
MKTKLLLFLILFSSLGCKLKQQETLPLNGLLWKITGNGINAPSYLFGTVHLQEGMQIFDSIRNLDSIFISTKQLISEIDILKSHRNLGFNKNDENTKKAHDFLKPWPIADSTYENILSSRESAILDSALSFDKSLKIIKDWKIRPLNAISFIKRAYDKNYNNFNKSNVYDSTKNIIIDNYFQLQANKYKMDIIELDSGNIRQIVNDSIVSHLPQLSYRSEVDLLIYYVQNMRQIDSLQREYLKMTMSKYLHQEINFIKMQPQEGILQILSYLGNDKCTEILNRFILDERNNLWIKQLPSLIKNKSSFIAVGAAHLGGDKGLINQLRNLNYTVIPVR